MPESASQVRRPTSERIRFGLFRSTSSWARWTEQRFTDAGRRLTSGALFFGVFGMDVDRATTYQAFGFTASLAALALFSARAPRERLRVDRRLPRFATAGESTRYTVAIHNDDSTPAVGLWASERVVSPLPTFEEFHRAPQPATSGDPWADWSGWTRWMSLIRLRRSGASSWHEVPAIAAGSAAQISLEMTPRRRGTLHLSGIDVGRTDPTGVCRASSLQPKAEGLLVLPRRYPLPPLEALGSQRFQQGGVSLASTIGEAQEFVELREYRPGDPMRKIHWRSWAKLGTPVVKEHQDEYFVRSALVLDTFGPPGEVFEEAVSVAASFACGALTEDSLLDLLFVEDRVHRFTAGRGVGTVDRLLEVLASVGPGAGPGFGALRTAVLEQREAISGCTCVFLDWDESRAELLRDLRAAGVSTRALWIRAATAPLGEAPPGVDVLELGRIAEGLAALSPRPLGAAA